MTLFNLNSVFDKNYFKEYFKYLLILLIGLNIVISYIYHSIYNSYSDNVDLENLIEIHIPDDNILVSFDKYKIIDDYNVVIYRENIDKHFYPENSIYMKDVINETILYTNLFFLILHTIVFTLHLYKETKKRILIMMGAEGSLREQNMRILTENIHHELNTPVAIIRGSIKQLELDIVKSNNDKINPLSIIRMNFSELYYALDQINTVLQRMSNFKQIKYSSNSKTVGDVIHYSANSMNIYKRSNFKINIGDEFNKYNLIGDLGNGDLMNIISNHLKNSLEAGSSRIIVQGKFREYDKKPYHGELSIFIVDNGNGIRDRKNGLPLDSSSLNDVFKPYYSTKDSFGKNKKIVKNYTGIKKYWTKFTSFFDDEEQNNELRGIGLYLNKQMLIENNGNLLLRETSESGTVFEIVVQAKETETSISQKELLKMLGKL